MMALIVGRGFSSELFCRLRVGGFDCLCTDGVGGFPVGFVPDLVVFCGSSDVVNARLLFPGALFVGFVGSGRVKRWDGLDLVVVKNRLNNGWKSVDGEIVSVGCFVRFDVVKNDCTEALFENVFGEFVASLIGDCIRSKRI